jgi:hypothetical protein
MFSNVLLIFAASWAAIFTSDPGKGAICLQTCVNAYHFLLLVVVQTVMATLPFLSLYIALQGFGAWLESMFGVLGKSVCHNYLCYAPLTSALVGVTGPTCQVGGRNG